MVIYPTLTLTVNFCELTETRDRRKRLVTTKLFHHVIVIIKVPFCTGDLMKPGRSYTVYVRTNFMELEFHTQGNFHDSGGPTIVHIQFFTCTKYFAVLGSIVKISLTNVCASTYTV